MRWLLALGIALTVGCGVQTENSSSNDSSTSCSAFGATSSAVAACTVITANCAGCHTFHTQTESQLIASGRVIAGQPLTSPLYYRLNGSSGSSGPKNMPPSGAMSAGDVEAVRTWILGL